MKIPKTKDGKQDIVFPTQAIHNHFCRVRDAFEGRLLFEVT